MIVSRWPMFLQASFAFCEVKRVQKKKMRFQTNANFETKTNIPVVDCDDVIISINTHRMKSSGNRPPISLPTKVPFLHGRQGNCSSTDRKPEPRERRKSSLLTDEIIGSQTGCYKIIIKVEGGHAHNCWESHNPIT